MPLTDKEQQDLATAEFSLRAALSIVLKIKSKNVPKKSVSDKRIKAKAISQALIAKMDRKVKAA